MKLEDAPNRKSSRREKRHEKEPFSLPPSDLLNEKEKEFLSRLEIPKRTLEEMSKIQQHLEDVRDYYAHLFEFAPIGFLLLTKKGIIKHSNIAACELLDMDGMQITGTSFSDYWPEAERTKLLLHLTDAFKTGYFTPIDISIKNFNNRNLTLLLNGRITKQQSIAEAMCYISIQDITELRKTESELQQNDYLFREKENVKKYLNLAPVIFLMIDADNKVLMINEKGCNIFGYKPNEVMGKDWFTNFVVPEGNEKNYTYYNFENKKLLWVPYFECGILCKNGERKLIGWRNTTIFDSSGSILSTLCAGEDITERKKLETHKNEYTEELEEIIEERTKKLREALKNEQNLNVLKSSFISLASHELRTPLTIIMSSIILIEKYHKAMLFDNEPKHISRIKESVKQFTTILDDFLSLDKLERGILIAHNDHFNLKELLVQTKAEVDGICKNNQKIEIKYKGTQTVFTDQKILRNVLINLLSNAIKYSEKDILLSVTVITDSINIQVMDKGIGIGKEEQKYVFTRFFRAENTINTPGTGLGLSIVKGYMELLEGSIKFKSKINEGSTFTLIIPIRN